MKIGDKLENAHQNLDIDATTAEEVECAYRRGVHQTFFTAVDLIEGAKDLKEAIHRLNIATEAAEEIRYDKSRKSDFLLDEVVAIVSEKKEAIRNDPRR